MKLNRQNTRTNRKMYQQILFMVGFVVGYNDFCTDDRQQRCPSLGVSKNAITVIRK